MSCCKYIAINTIFCLLFAIITLNMCTQIVHSSITMNNCNRTHEYFTDLGNVTIDLALTTYNFHMETFNLILSLHGSELSEDIKTEFSELMSEFDKQRTNMSEEIMKEFTCNTEDIMITAYVSYVFEYLICMVCWVYYNWLWWKNTLCNHGNTTENNFLNA